MSGFLCKFACSHWCSQQGMGNCCQHDAQAGLTLRLGAPYSEAELAHVPPPLCMSCKKLCGYSLDFSEYRGLGRRIFILEVKIHEGEGQLEKSGVFTGLLGKKLLEEDKVQIRGVCSLSEVLRACWLSWTLAQHMELAGCHSAFQQSHSSTSWAILSISHLPGLK